MEKIDMVFTPEIRYLHDVGYYIDVNDTTFHSDTKTIKILKVDKDYYIDNMLKYGATNHCTREFPSMMFNTRRKAELAKDEFIMPLCLAAILVQNCE